MPTVMSDSPTPRSIAGRLGLLAAASVLAACGAKEPAAAGGGRGMPPATVGVITVQPHSVALQTELPGRVEPLRVAQVRARVNGVVLQRQFTEGSDVKAASRCSASMLRPISPAPPAPRLRSPVRRPM